MQNDLSSLDKRVIQSLLKKKSFADIAEIIDKPLNVATDYILQYLEGKNIETFQQKLTNKVEAKRKRQSEEQDKKNRKKDYDTQQRKKRLSIDQEMINNRKRRNEPVFQTKVIDHSKMVSVRIDAKTIIQVPQGTDTNKAKENYLQRLKDSRPVQISTQKKVNKFKPV